MRRLLACILLLAGCRTAEPPEAVYQKAIRASRNGNASEALTLARQAAQRCPAGSECRAAARLLEAETLLRDGRLDAAAAILAEPLPQGRAFEPWKARSWMLQGGLAITRGRLDEAQNLLRRSEELAASIDAWAVLYDAQHWQG
ncbi:MAG TPA: hypothetical protein VG672_06495, partial [Bryobacteraceae bacterium]|nr:hypothetical protein [Bryobacteraceae bacterium]